MHLKCIATIVFRLCLLLLLLLCRWFHALIMVLEGALLNRHFGMHLYCSNRWGICRDWFSWDRTQCCVLRCSAGYQQRWTGQLLHSTHGRRFLSPACTAQTTQNGEVKLQELRKVLQDWTWKVEDSGDPRKKCTAATAVRPKKTPAPTVARLFVPPLWVCVWESKVKVGECYRKRVLVEGERAVAERRW